MIHSAWLSIHFAKERQFCARRSEKFHTVKPGSPHLNRRPENVPPPPAPAPLSSRTTPSGTGYLRREGEIARMKCRNNGPSVRWWSVRGLVNSTQCWCCGLCNSEVRPCMRSDKYMQRSAFKSPKPLRGPDVCNCMHVRDARCILRRRMSLWNGCDKDLLNALNCVFSSAVHTKWGSLKCYDLYFGGFSNGLVFPYGTYKPYI